MKTTNPYVMPLLLIGIMLMAFFGTRISASIGGPNSMSSQLMIAGYTIGLLLIGNSNFMRLKSYIKDLESKIEKLENKGI
jgi:hypothetical protein